MPHQWHSKQDTADTGTIKQKTCQRFRLRSSMNFLLFEYLIYLENTEAHQTNCKMS